MARPTAPEPAWAVVPVRSTGSGKQRLAGYLTPARRRALCEAMLTDVLRAVCAVGSLAGVIVIAAHDDVRPVVSRFPVRFRLQDQPGGDGLNAAVQEVAGDLSCNGAATLLVLPADLPQVTAPVLEAALAAHASTRRRKRITLVADAARSGTNLLIASPPTAVPFAFGPGSCQAHRRLAEERGVAVRWWPAPTLANDIDMPADLTALARRGDRGLGPDTTRWLATLAGLDPPLLCPGLRREELLS